MEKYNPQSIEKKWQKRWEKEGVFKAKDNKQPKFYALVEFPYPSGEGLHVGHPRSYTAMDILARKRRMEGYKVLYPIGFDSFGLPTENYAIKTGRPPAEITKENIANFTKQLKSLGFSFDWDRAVTTSDPSYYKWTQWIFLQLFKHGLAYKKKMAINWCPSCKIGLANEEVVDGSCERCGTSVEKREKEQWMLAITKYADKLLEGLKEVDYIERAKVQQENWIGRSEGLIFTAPVKDMALKIETFSAHFESCYADTFVVIAPDHQLLPNLLDDVPNKKDILEFCKQILAKRVKRGAQEEKEPEGIFTGRYIVDPLGNGDLPIWVASFALADYGTGIVKCSAHDERDFAFAKKYNLRLKPVLFPKDPAQKKRVENLEECFTDMKDGYLSEPKEFAGRRAGEVRKEIIEYLTSKGFARTVTQYKLRDWVFSRQRYWGEPIPLVYCEACKNRKKKIVFVHGFGGHSQENWFPWFKKEIESKGWAVFIPDLPHTNEPDMNEWVKALMTLPVEDGDDVVVIAHSLGGLAACKFVEKKNIQVRKLILVAPTGKSSDWQQLKPYGFSEEDIGRIKNFGKEKIDFNKLRKIVKEPVLYFSKDDPYIPLHIKEDYIDLHARERIFDNKKHFNAKFGFTAFPEILEEFQSGEDLNTGWIPLPEKELPLKLPKVEKYQPTDTGESPLAGIEKWVKTKCPRCGGQARRETDTMPNWAGSSWYFLRYCDPENKKEFSSMERLRYWMDGNDRGHGGVDWYNGGMEHTVLHLLYSRFWNQFLYDIGLVPTREPYKKRTSHGMILAEDGEKMSKSRGNVINPDEIIKQYGADTLRLYEMFMGPFDQAVPWSTASIAGIQRFLERVWGLSSRLEQIKQNKQNKQLERLMHKTIKKVTEDIEQMKFNTAIAALMSLVNEIIKQDELLITNYQLLITILNPFAPHITEELWNKIGGKGLLAQQTWPSYDPALVKDEEIELVIQVNGKVRDRIKTPADITEEEAKATALQSEKIKTWLNGKSVQSVIFVPGKLINIVIKN